MAEKEETPTKSKRKASTPNRDGKRKAAPTSSSPQDLDRKNAPVRLRIPEQMYGNEVARGHVRDVCAGCLGRKNEELKNEPILMCDGNGCGREYHVRCCLPPLTPEEIPEDSYLCIDCDKDGTSSNLEHYFDDTWDSRSKYSTSREFVETLFDNDQRIPVSEIPQMTQMHRHALSGVGNIQGTSVPNELGPDFLIGKPIRLYCPEGNSYHDGRVIDWRRATHLRPTSPLQPSDENDFMYGDISEVARCEFLVAFPAGLNYRKRTVHQWLILEEHSLAVGTTLIWSLNNEKTKWCPGLLWLRTSFELNAVRDLLDEAGDQILYDRSKIGKRINTWALAQMFGGERHALLLLHEDSVDFFAPFFAERISRPLETADGPRLELDAMLAYAEVDEQRQVRHWFRLPLKDYHHERALNIADKYMLPPLELNAGKPQDVIMDQGPRPCPLIRQGLDRIWIMKQLELQGVEQAKDTAADMTVQKVKSRPAAIHKLQEQAKAATSNVK